MLPVCRRYSGVGLVQNIVLKAGVSGTEGVQPMTAETSESASAAPTPVETTSSPSPPPTSDTSDPPKVNNTYHLHFTFIGSRSSCSSVD